MRFSVTGLNAACDVATCELTARDEADARRLAAGRGLRVLSVAVARFRFSGRGHLALVPFTNELIALLDAGLSLVESLDALSEKERDAATRSVLEAISGRLYEGLPLSAALAEFPDSFPTLYVATVRASERSGAITLALQRYVSYQERIDVLKRQLINASIYPAVLLGVGTLVVLFLVAYVVPRFAGIYEEVGGDMPWASRLLMHWGQLLDAHGLLVAAVATAGLCAVVYGALRPAVRIRAGQLLARIPTLSRQLKLYQLARLYRTVGMLIRGGLPVVTAFEMTQGLLATSAQPQLAAATRAVREGQSLADSLARHGLTTAVAERMLRVGERSGNMGDMMERIAAFYDTELSRWVEIATRLIEPAMMTVIGLLIGGIVVLMYFPIFELAGTIQ